MNGHKNPNDSHNYHDEYITPYCYIRSIWNDEIFAVYSEYDV